MQKTRGGTLIFVAGILYIIFGALTLILLAVSLAAVGALGLEVFSTADIVSLVFSIVVVVCEFAAGIYAVRYAHNLAKAGKLFENAIALLVIMIINIASVVYAGSFTALNFIALILPILMIAGASINKKEAREAGVELEKSGKKNSAS